VFVEESKDLLLTLVKSHSDMKDIGQDIIPGKGLSIQQLREYILTEYQAMASWFS
jgi:hypothetical protein